MEQNRTEKVIKRKLRRSAEEIQHHLQEQVKGGLTIKDYCQANGISVKNFYRWAYRRRKYPVKRLRKKKRAQAGFAKIELLQPDAIPDKPLLFAEIGNLRLYKEVPVEYLKALLL
jgi:hypothetical protein